MDLGIVKKARVLDEVKIFYFPAIKRLYYVNIVLLLCFPEILTGVQKTRDSLFPHFSIQWFSHLFPLLPHSDSRWFSLMIFFFFLLPHPLFFDFSGSL